MGKEEVNQQSISSFFMGHNGSKNCRLTYTTKNGNKELDDVNVTATIDTFLNVSYRFDDTNLAWKVDQDGTCFGMFSPTYQDFKYDAKKGELVIEGKGNGKKEDYTAVFK